MTPLLSYKWFVLQRNLQIEGLQKDLKVDEKRVREWKLQKEKLKQLCAAKKKSKKRLPGGGGKPKLGDLEERIVSSIDEMRS